jgi:hypothetical protein
MVTFALQQQTQSRWHILLVAQDWDDQPRAALLNRARFLMEGSEDG